jgi:uncharacterized protein
VLFAHDGVLPTLVRTDAFNVFKAGIRAVVMDVTFYIAIVVGFLAQIIDGTLGMAYGVSSSSFLLGMGIPPAAASASVHTAEIFTTAVSGLSHLRFGNVDKKLLPKLLLPGIVGAVLGAYVLTALPGNRIKPFIALYLFVMGIVILRKALNHTTEREIHTHVAPLGLAGGFFDAIGGGGWGPIVTTTLLARGNHVRFTVGTVNAAEFFVTVAASITFFISIGLTHLYIILGLILGGVLAAPLAAYICKKLPARVLMFVVGILIILLSIRTIYLSL